MAILLAICQQKLKKYKKPFFNLDLLPNRNIFLISVLLFDMF